MSTDVQDKNLEVTIENDASKWTIVDKMLYTPSPIALSLGFFLSIDDIIKLAHVCRRWRRNLISCRDPEVSKEKQTIRWRYLLTTLSSHDIGPTNPKNGRSIREAGKPSRIYFYKRDENKYAINFTVLGFIFDGPNCDYNYARRITRINLDGMTVDAWWVKLLLEQCRNVKDLSVRSCKSFSFMDLARYVAGGYGIWNEWVEPLPLVKLRRVRFWGVGGLDTLTSSFWHNRIDCIEEWVEAVERVLCRYETDVAWCRTSDGELHKSGMAQVCQDKVWVCGGCGVNRQAQCSDCEMDLRICEKCDGWFCTDCLKLEDGQSASSINHIRRIFANRWPSISSYIDEDIPDSDANTYYYSCYMRDCQWRRNLHFVHASCIGKFPSIICTNCENYICAEDKRTCEFCGAGVFCCRTEGVMCKTCPGYRVCVCDNCFVKKGEHVHVGSDKLGDLYT